MQHNSKLFLAPFIRSGLLDILALLLGAISLFAFAPFQLYGWLFLSIAGLFWVLQAGSLARAVWRGWLYGAGAYGIGMLWLFAIAEHVAATDGVNPIVVGILGAILLLVMLAPLLIAWLYRLLANHIAAPISWQHGLGFAAIWVFIEWLRSWLFSGFPLLQPGYAVVETPLSAWAPIGSVLAVTFVVVLLSVWLVLLVLPCATLRQRLYRIGVCVSLVGCSIGLTAFDWTTPTHQPLQVRLIHGLTDQVDKYKRFKVMDTVEDYLARSTVKPLPDLVIWPESSIAFALRDVYYLIHQPAQDLQTQGTTLLLGAYIDTIQGMQNVLVEATALDRYYAKRHLVPYGEYTPTIPGLDLAQHLPDLAMNELAPGDPVQPLLQVQDIPLATTICFENLFGHEQRHGWQQARFLVQISDLAWFVHTWAADQLLQVSQMRAREAAKPVLQATNHGITAAIDFQGIIQQRSDADTKVIDTVLIPRTGTTPYTDFAEWPLGVLIIGCLMVAMRRRAP